MHKETDSFRKLAEGIPMLNAVSVYHASASVSPEYGPHRQNRDFQKQLLILKQQTRVSDDRAFSKNR